MDPDARFNHELATYVIVNVTLSGLIALGFWLT
ncbi:putative membrane protein [Sinorhizobium sp. RAC02]|jgi:hypothetical protein|nr:putative membrane protein [Sinorhizobium sp. RAC02]